MPHSKEHLGEWDHLLPLRKSVLLVGVHAIFSRLNYMLFPPGDIATLPESVLKDFMMHLLDLIYGAFVCQ